MIKKPEISVSDIPEFRTGSTLTADMFNNIVLLIEYVAAEHGFPIQKLKRYSKGSALTASDMNNYVAIIEGIYQHIGSQIPDWTFEKFKIGGKFRASDLNEIVKSLKTLESIKQK